jgi:peptidoglycan hydrolase CwlO-like protein
MLEMIKTAGVCITLLIPAGAGFEYYLDHEFLSLDRWEIANAESDKRALKREIRQLEYDVEEGTATEKEAWELKQLEEELEDLQEEIDALKG